MAIKQIGPMTDPILQCFLQRLSRNMVVRSANVVDVEKMRHPLSKPIVHYDAFLPKQVSDFQQNCY